MWVFRGDSQSTWLEEISTEWEVKSEERDWEQETHMIFPDATVLLVSVKPQAKQTD